MSGVLADTHAIVWYLFDTDRLSATADERLTTAAREGKLYISVMTLVEVSYLAGRKSFPYSDVLARLLDLADDPAEPLQVLPVTLEVARSLELVPRVEVPDMPDRIVAATAVAHGLPLITQDSEILGADTLRSRIEVIW